MRVIRWQAPTSTASCASAQCPGRPLARWPSNSPTWKTSSPPTPSACTAPPRTRCLASFRRGQSALARSQTTPSCSRTPRAPGSSCAARSSCWPRHRPTTCITTSCGRAVLMCSGGVPPSCAISRAGRSTREARACQRSPFTLVRSSAHSVMRACAALCKLCKSRHRLPAAMARTASSHCSWIALVAIALRWRHRRRHRPRRYHHRRCALAPSPRHSRRSPWDCSSSRTSAPPCPCFASCVGTSTVHRLAMAPIAQLAMRILARWCIACGWTSRRRCHSRRVSSGSSLPPRSTRRRTTMLQR